LGCNGKSSEDKESGLRSRRASSRGAVGAMVRRLRAWSPQAATRSSAPYRRCRGSAILSTPAARVCMIHRQHFVSGDWRSSGLTPHPARELLAPALTDGEMPIRTRTPMPIGACSGARGFLCFGAPPHGLSKAPHGPVPFTHVAQHPMPRGFHPRSHGLFSSYKPPQVRRR
jgi:hypothetical protein